MKSWRTSNKATFFDVGKAYQIVNHKFPIFICKRYGPWGKMSEIVKSPLIGSSQFVEFNNQQFYFKLVKAGVS